MLATAVLPQASLPFQAPKRTRALTPEQVTDLRAAHKAGAPVRVLAERFSIGKSMAHEIATGKLYADVDTKPGIAWFDPIVRYRGYHSDAECRAIGAMLRQNPGRWALVKQNRTKPDASHYESWGLEASAIQIAGRGSDWCLYVRFPAVQSALAG